MLIGGVNQANSANILLSSSEREYIRMGVGENLRADGRTNKALRSLKVELGVVPQASGSARVRLGGSDVLVSIKGDISVPSEEEPHKGIVKCMVDASSVASLAAGMGAVEDRQVQERNAELTAILNDIFIKSGALPREKLCIVKEKHCWWLYIDALVLEYDGNLIDPLVLATRFALDSLTLPSVRIEEGGEATEIVLAEEADPDKHIDASILPITVTIAKIGNTYCVDPTKPEELCTEAALLISLNPSTGDVIALRKVGCGYFDPASLPELLSIAREAASVYGESAKC